MTFGLKSWLKSGHGDLDYEVPLFYPSREQPDHREWLLTNGLGGFSMATVSGAHTRRYHGLLIAALEPPHERHVVLSRIDEILCLNGREFQLATNHWASGVVSPTGYKYLESFSLLPCPTWVFEIDGHYLIKQVVLTWGTNEAQVGYSWLPDPERADASAVLTVRFLTGFRNFHGQITGSSDDRYPQFVSPKHSVIILNESTKRLCLSWNQGEYEPQKQWWWSFHWPEESMRGLPDTEDLFFVGQVVTTLEADKQFSIGASLDRPITRPDCKHALDMTIVRQKQLLSDANLPNTVTNNLLVLASDQFLVAETSDEDGDLSVIEGYPWFSQSGRSAMVSLSGLTLSTRRFEHAKRLLRTNVKEMRNGMSFRRLIEAADDETHVEYGAADVTLWMVSSLYSYFRKTKDAELVKELLPKLLEAIGYYRKGTVHGVKVDISDGLLRCGTQHQEFTWMDSRVATIPITPRAGKAVEINALWYNCLETILFLSSAVGIELSGEKEIKELAETAKQSMQKFWNANTLCLYDVLEPGAGTTQLPDQSIRPNQIIAVALPYRALNPQQERAILMTVESELLTPTGLRSLAATDLAYQGIFGCGLPHADQYHRDLSYHQGMVWPWLIGPYCDALVNVHGSTPETANRISKVLQPLLAHLAEEATLGSVSEIFDGDRPHAARGCGAEAWSVAELLRWVKWLARH